MASRHALAACAALALLAGNATAVPAAPAPVSEQAQRTNDVAIVRHAGEGLAGLVAYMRTQPQLFPAQRPERPRVLEPAQRQEVLQLWARFLDHQLILDTVVGRQDESAARRRRMKAQEADAREAFRTGYAAFLSRYRHALEFIELVDRDPTLRIVLDEPVDAIGLPAGTYSQFKLRHLHVRAAAEFAALALRNKQQGSDGPFALTDAMRDDEAYLWRAGRGNGLARTLDNAGQVVQGTSFKVYFPVQKGVSEWMGDTRVLYGSRFLVGEKQIEQLAPRLRPGDVMLVRREWFLSNIGLPGFWPHSALYLGTKEERDAWFDTPEVAAWLKTQGVDDGRVDTLLRQRQPEAYAKGLGQDGHGDPYRVIEAMSEGVVFTSLQHAAGGDSVAVLRPRLSRVDVAKALLKSLGYQGRPYDFNFDFRSDDTLVCTELVYKSYAARPGEGGLRFGLQTVMGRPVITANDIAQQFDQNFDTPEQQFDFVAFFDGQQRAGQAEEADLARFRASWKRPKWHVVTQNTSLGAK